MTDANAVLDIAKSYTEITKQKKETENFGKIEHNKKRFEKKLNINNQVRNSK